MQYTYTTFKELMPTLAEHLHTLICESCLRERAEVYTHEGTETHGSGVYRGFPYTVSGGKIRVNWSSPYGSFRRVHNMRKPVRMKLHGGWSFYDMRHLLP